MTDGSRFCFTYPPMHASSCPDEKDPIQNEHHRALGTYLGSTTFLLPGPFRCLLSKFQNRCTTPIFLRVFVMWQVVRPKNQVYFAPCPGRVILNASTVSTSSPSYYRCCQSCPCCPCSPASAGETAATARPGGAGPRSTTLRCSTPAETVATARPGGAGRRLKMLRSSTAGRGWMG